MFVEYANMPIVRTRNSKVKISPMQFAIAPRPTFYYSEDHFTDNWDHYPDDSCNPTMESVRENPPPPTNQN